ncbi:hypothetical protein HYN56_11955 [Flavobacterium crocinum]|uniref:Uncharacterized protein n=1 Tax=Flavobacterium crocinum TaxID=2183896 RepID=A0A2S1YLI5_9FLAO|nr:hypothetical protein HYN56_11955 [Flavobacterium crocinum]
MDFFVSHELHKFTRIFNFEFSQNAQNIARGFNHGKRTDWTQSYIASPWLKPRAIFEYRNQREEKNSCKFVQFVANKK